MNAEKQKNWRAQAMVWLGRINQTVIFLAAVAAITAFFSPGTVIDFLERFDDRAAAIEDATTRTATNTERLVDETRALPDAVARDPVRELQNRGYAFSKTDFRRAARAEDVVTVRLFCAAGKEDWLGDNTLMFNITLRSDTFEVMRDCRAYDAEAFCSRRTMDPFDASTWRNATQNRENYIAFCGRSAIRDIERRQDEDAAARQARRAQADAKARDLCRAVADQMIAEIHEERHPYTRGWVVQGYERRLDQTPGLSSWQCAQWGIGLQTIWADETRAYR